jgi:hypothetical protein
MWLSEGWMLTRNSCHALGNKSIPPYRLSYNTCLLSVIIIAVEVAGLLSTGDLHTAPALLAFSFRDDAPSTDSPLVYDMCTCVNDGLSMLPPS